MFGVQFAWTVELAYGTQFLLELGLKPWATSLVWLAGPISGLIVHPMIGKWSDSCTFKWGRRRPFVLFGALLTSFGFFLISHSQDFLFSKTLAVVGFYILDFALNTAQSSSRALIIDCSVDQEKANAMATLMMNLGSIFGYLVGYIDLQATFGHSQITILCFIASFVICLCATLSSLSCSEEVSEYSSRDLMNVHQVLPEIIRKVFKNQFFCWMGWFIILFYSATYVSMFEKDKLLGARMGSMALLFFSIVSSITSIVLLNLKPSFTLWKFGNVWFFVITMLTFFCHNSTQAMFLISLLGVPWAIGVWVPISLIALHVHEDTGCVLGLHNMYIVMPQILVAFVQTLLFWYTDITSVAWMIRLSGFIALWIL